MKYLFFLLIITLSYGFLHGAIVFESKDERGQLWQVDANVDASGMRSVRISRDGKTVSTFPGGGIASNVHGDLMKEPSPIKDFFVGEENLWIVSRHQADFSELRKVNLNSGKCEIVEIPRVGHELMLRIVRLDDSGFPVIRLPKAFSDNVDDWSEFLLQADNSWVDVSEGIFYPFKNPETYSDGMKWRYETIIARNEQRKAKDPNARLIPVPAYRNIVEYCRLKPNEAKTFLVLGDKRHPMVTEEEWKQIEPLLKGDKPTIDDTQTKPSDFTPPQARPKEEKPSLHAWYFAFGALVVSLAGLFLWLKIRSRRRKN